MTMTDATDNIIESTNATSDATPTSESEKKAPMMTTSTTTTTEPARSSGAGTVFFALFLSVLASGALVVGAPFWTPYTADIIDLPNPLSAVVSETARLSRVVVDMDGRIATVSGDTAALKAQAAAGAKSRDGVRAATLALAGAQLRDRLAGGQAYELQLAAVRALAVGDEELTRVVVALAPYASTGVATREVLRDAFPSAVAAAVTAEAESATRAAAGWYESASALLGQLGYVMHLSEVPTGSAHAIVRAAREKLVAGDLEGAAAQMSGLPEPRPEEAAAWIEAARARVAADKADSALATLSLSRLAAP